MLLPFIGASGRERAVWQSELWDRQKRWNFPRKCLPSKLSPGQPPAPPPPAWGLRDDRIPGTDQAVRGGRHGPKLHSGFPPRKVDARSSADARSSTDACLS